MIKCPGIMLITIARARVLSVQRFQYHSFFSIVFSCTVLVLSSSRIQNSIWMLLQFNEFQAREDFLRRVFLVPARLGTEKERYHSREGNYTDNAHEQAFPTGNSTVRRDRRIPRRPDNHPCVNRISANKLRWSVPLFGSHKNDVMRAKRHFQTNAKAIDMSFSTRAISLQSLFN